LLVGQWALQCGIIFAWLVFTSLPILRGIWIERKALSPHTNDSLGMTEPTQKTPTSESPFSPPYYIHLHPLFILTVILSLLYSIQIWDISLRSWGWITLGGAGLYAYISWILMRWNFSRQFSNTYRLIAAGLLAISLILLLKGKGSILLFSLAVEAVLIHGAGYRVRKRSPLYKEKAFQVLAHSIIAGVGIWLLIRLVIGYHQHIAFLTVRSFVHVLVIAMGAGVIPFLAGRYVRWIYGFASHILFLIFLFCVFGFLKNGQGIVSFLWGIYAVFLLILGLRYKFDLLRKTAMATLFLVVAKLFLIDLIAVKAIWRIVLFLSFGGLLLIISYYIQALVRRKSDMIH
jgi:hypothetical protein